MSRKSIKIVIFGVLFAFICTFLVPYASVCVKAQEEIPYSQAECVMELNSRRILYEYRGETRLPMASTTKIATAMTVLEACNNVTNKQITIPREAVGVEGSSVYLAEGDVYTTEELLYGLMLRSGNDCATALALHCCGSVPLFCAKMNETARKAGAVATNFRNPHGLPCKNHYTTARDLSLIACYALKNPIFRQIVSTQDYAPKHWKNKNKMLTAYDGAIGVKTGYTKEAGRCLVTAAERGGMTLVCSVLNSPMMYERTAKLMDDAFASYSYTKLLSNEDVFTVKGEKRTLKACVREDYYYPLMQGEEESIEICILPINSSTDREIVGQIQIYLAKRLLFSANLYKL